VNLVGLEGDRRIWPSSIRLAKNGTNLKLTPHRHRENPTVDTVTLMEQFTKLIVSESHGGRLTKRQWKESVKRTEVLLFPGTS
jgi:hypothetical protein